MRIPVATSLKSRDGTTTKDPKVVNGLIEPDGEEVVRVTARPGSSDLGLVRAGTAQGAYYFNGQIITVHSNTADRTTLPLSNTSIGTVDGARSVSSLSRALADSLANTNLTNVGNVATATSTAGNHGLNIGDPFQMSGAALALYNGSFTVASVTSPTIWTYILGGVPIGGAVGTALVPSRTTATAVTAVNHGFRGSGQQVTIAGASPSTYNGTVTVTITGSQSFTYPIAGNPTTPATGTITATPSPVSTLWRFADNGLTFSTTGFLLMQGQAAAHRLRSDWNLSDYIGANFPGATVVGCVFLDGYFFVMDADGNIWNCDLDSDPGDGANWKLTSFIKANKFSGSGVCLTRSVNYVVALKEFSTEPYYDAGNPAPGSPLSPVDNAYSQVGCASAASVAQVEGSLAFISQSRSKGRSVHLMTGAQQQRVSTPDIERILDADDLATVYAFGCKLEGHVLYFLTLVTTNITLVYDATTKTWMQWSSLTAQTPVSITSLVRSGTTVTATFSGAHNLNDGDPLLIAGASPAAYNGVWQTSYVSATVATFQIFSSPTTPATGTITGAHYSETYFKFSHYVNAGGRDVLLHESDGHLYEILPSLHADAGVPFKVFNRTGTVDGGDTTQKPMARIVVVADTVDAYLMVRWSDDDCATFSKYQAVHLSLDRPRIRRCGTFRRRIVETCFVSSGNPLRIEALELEGAG